MKRLFWLALGVTVGALLVRKLTRTAQSLSPSGIAATVSGSVGGLAAAVREFADEEGTGVDGKLGARPEDF